MMQKNLSSYETLVLATSHAKILADFMTGSPIVRTGSMSQDTNMIIERLGEFDNTSFRLKARLVD